ncbi:MAG: hypothetical protein ACYTEL_22395 [Planctomycetota bacterium]|jgi:hypothetical protein
MALGAGIYDSGGRTIKPSPPGNVVFQRYSCDDDCPNLDGLNPVSFIDFSILAQNWLLTSPGRAGDLDNSQVVDEDDLWIFTDYWLSNCYQE